MATVAVARRPAPPRAACLRSTRHHLLEWYVAGRLVAFAIPLIATNLLELHHDLFLLVYFTIAGTFLASFVAAHTPGRLARMAADQDVVEYRRRGGDGVGDCAEGLDGGVDAAPVGKLLLVRGGVARRAVRDDGRPAVVRVPGNGRYLLLRDSDRRRRLRFAGLSLLLSIGITATYHLGYPQFRGADLAQPEIGALVAWVPTALTGNPIGAVIVHDSYHVAANVHTYRSPIYLPPDLAGYAERGSGAAGLALAALWIVVAGTLIYAERRRLFPQVEEAVAESATQFHVRRRSMPNAQSWDCVAPRVGWHSAVFRMPLFVYRHRWGSVLGRTFLLLVHVGRKTGKPHSTVAMVLADDRHR